jgi:phosphate transport system permease protein
LTILGKIKQFRDADKDSGDISPILKKPFRFVDRLAESIIKSVAFLSIAFVILIFVFIFRETLPIFTPDRQGEAVSRGYPPPEAVKDLAPEEYSPVSPDTSFLLVPESNGTESEDTSGKGVVPLEEKAAAASGKVPGTLLSKEWLPVSDSPRYGLLPLFLGTLKVTLIAILIAGPLAILAALYTSLFAPKKIRAYVKPAIELLAAFPTVVIGLFALIVMASFFQDLFGYSGRLNAFVGGIAMALAAIPVIYTLTEDALSAVPLTYIEASLGLGASLRQTAFQVVLPTATPGIFAALLLGIGRVFGETMIALMVTGNAALMTISPFDPVRTLSATIGAEMAEVVFGDTHYRVLFLIGSVLFLITFTLNALAEFYFRNRFIKRLQGK